MAKTVFTHASSRAVEGIRKIYADKDAVITVMHDKDSDDFTVVVLTPA